MKSYLRKTLDEAVKSNIIPDDQLKEIRRAVPQEIVQSEWADVITFLFFEIGDTAYSREGYHNAVNLIEKHLFSK